MLKYGYKGKKDKGKPFERWGRKATGATFARTSQPVAGINRDALDLPDYCEGKSICRFSYKTSTKKVGEKHA